MLINAAISLPRVILWWICDYKLRVHAIITNYGSAQENRFYGHVDNHGNEKSKQRYSKNNPATQAKDAQIMYESPIPQSLSGVNSHKS
jgi:hypothetical protein